MLYLIFLTLHSTTVNFSTVYYLNVKYKYIKCKFVRISNGCTKNFRYSYVVPGTYTRLYCSRDTVNKRQKKTRNEYLCLITVNKHTYYYYVAINTCGTCDTFGKVSPLEIGERAPVYSTDHGVTCKTRG